MRTLRGRRRPRTIYMLRRCHAKYNSKREAKRRLARLYSKDKLTINPLEPLCIKQKISLHGNPHPSSS
jgi:hypothetical protein